MEDLLVRIDDAWVNRDGMNCLFHDHEHVNGGVSMLALLLN